MPDGRSLGQVLHEAREAGGQKRPRPWPPLPWAERERELKALDEAMAAAVAGAATADLRSRLADADNAIGQVIRLAESWQMQGGVIDVEHVAGVLLGTLKAWTGEGQERSEEKEAGRG
jgi:hypothetical protein